MSNLPDYDNRVKETREIINKIKNKTTKEICEQYFEDRINNITHISFAADSLNYIKAFIKCEKLNIDIISPTDIACLCNETNKTTRILFQIFCYTFENRLSKSMNINQRPYMFLKMQFNPKYMKLLIADPTIENRTIYSFLERDGYYRQFVVMKSNKWVSDFLTDYYIHETKTVINQEFINNIAEYMLSEKAFSSEKIITDKFIEGYFERYSTQDKRASSEAKHFFINQIKKHPEKTKYNKYNITILSNPRFANNFNNGYRPVFYNNFDNIPSCDKWMLLPDERHINSYTTITNTTMFLVSFDDVIDHYYKQCLKQYFWQSNDKGLGYRVRGVAIIKDFLNTFMDDEHITCISITENICAEYKAIINNKYQHSNQTGDAELSVISNFLKFLENNNKAEVSPNAYYFLSANATKYISSSSDVKRDDIIAIATYFNTHKYDNFEYLMAYVIFHICLNTEFRISQIVNLKTDCVKQSMKKGEYLIVSETKVSSGTVVEQPCARVIKTVIDDYLSETADMREKIEMKEIKKYLFLREDSFNGIYKPISGTWFNNYLKKACNELEIENITAQNLRSTYITNAKEYVIKNGLSDTTLLGITAHKNVNTINNHYLQEQIKDALQATNNIIIGNVDVHGNIVNDDSSIIKGKENSVENECGYCQSEFCDLNGPLSCLLCSHFATTADRIPFFERQIEQLDKQIIIAENKHDVEDCVNLKRLFARYLEKLLILKGEMENDASGS